MRHEIELPWMALAVLVVALLAACRPATEADHVTETNAAMSRMMQDMHAPYSGDADRDFATMMIPHHQGAIDMALTQIRHGRNQRLRRLAQGIVVEQQQEIAVMRAVLDDELPPPANPFSSKAICRSRWQP